MYVWPRYVYELRSMGLLSPNDAQNAVFFASYVSSESPNLPYSTLYVYIHTWIDETSQFSWFVMCAYLRVNSRNERERERKPICITNFPTNISEPSKYWPAILRHPPSPFNADHPNEVDYSRKFFNIFSRGSSIFSDRPPAPPLFPLRSVFRWVSLGLT